MSVRKRVTYSFYNIRRQGLFYSPSLLKFLKICHKFPGKKMGKYFEKFRETMKFGEISEIIFPLNRPISNRLENRLEY